MTVESGIASGGIVDLGDGVILPQGVPYEWVRVPEQHGGQKAYVVESVTMRISGQLCNYHYLAHDHVDVIETLEEGPHYALGVFLWVAKKR